MYKKQILFIINPISGVGRKGKLPLIIDKELDHNRFNYKIVYTEYKGHAYFIGKEAVKNKYEIICIVGGDGSIHEVGSALIGSSVVLAIIPAGSGSGIARHLKIPINYKKAIQRMNQFQIGELDTFTVNDKIGIGFSGFGVDALIAKKFNETGKRGLYNYAKLVIKQFINYKGVNLVINHQQKEENLLFCNVVNTSQFGNNFHISPLSNHQDGLLELVLVKKMSFLPLLYLLTLSFFKQIHHSKWVKIISCEEIVLEVENSDVNIDGEAFIFNEKQIYIKCNPKSLRVII